MLEFPVLIGDIGGTNARFAVLPDARLPPILLPRTLTALHSTAVEAIWASLHGQACPRPRSALIAVATRVDSPVVRLTNAAWVIDAEGIGVELELSRVMLVNDFVPVAASLAMLRTDGSDLARLGPEVPAASGPKLVLGPGTGLGAAALLPMDERWAIQPTEAGHVDFGPRNAAEMALWPMIEQVGGRITAETLLSGPGLLRLYRAHAGLHARPTLCATPDAVTQAGLARSDESAVDSLRLFAGLLGRFSGDLALIFGATGGVFIGGGIAPGILPFLASAEFRASFEDKAPFGVLMGGIATFVIVHPEPALAGLSAITSDPGSFIFDHRSWPG